MRIAKIKDKMGYAVIGVVKVIPDKNGVAVSEVKFSDGTGHYRFKVRGASRQIARKDGTAMWRSQRMWCNLDIGSPFADIAKSLLLNDVIFVFGSIQANKYIGEDGRNRLSTNCAVEYIQLIGVVGGQIAETESDSAGDDEFDF